MRVARTAVPNIATYGSALQSRDLAQLRAAAKTLVHDHLLDPSATPSERLEGAALLRQMATSLGKGGSLAEPLFALTAKQASKVQENLMVPAFSRVIVLVDPDAPPPTPQFSERDIQNLAGATSELFSVLKSGAGELPDGMSLEAFFNPLTKRLAESGGGHGSYVASRIGAGLDGIELLGGSGAARP